MNEEPRSSAASLWVSIPLSFVGNYLLEKTSINLAVQPQYGFANPFTPLGRFMLSSARTQQEKAQQKGKQSLYAKSIYGLNRFFADEKFIQALNANQEFRTLMSQLIKGKSTQEVSNLFDIGIFTTSEALGAYFKQADKALIQQTGSRFVIKQAINAAQTGQLKAYTPFVYTAGKILSQWGQAGMYQLFGTLAIMAGTQIYQGFKSLGVRYKYLQYQRMVQSNAVRMSTVRPGGSSEENMYLQQQFAQLGNMMNEQQMLRENQYANYYYMGVNP